MMIARDLAYDDALAVFANNLSDEYHALAQKANDLADAYASRPVERPGIFRSTEGTFAVKTNREGTRMYAKRLCGRSWEYASGVIFRLSESHRMTVEECEALSLYIGSCAWCSRELTAEKSVKRGMGPVCAKRVQGF
jgi:hypothetical protein